MFVCVCVNHTAWTTHSCLCVYMCVFTTISKLQQRTSYCCTNSNTRDWWVWHVTAEWSTHNCRCVSVQVRSHLGNLWVCWWKIKATACFFIEIYSKASAASSLFIRTNHHHHFLLTNQGISTIATFNLRLIPDVLFGAGWSVVEEHSGAGREQSGLILSLMLLLWSIYSWYDMQRIFRVEK